MTITSTAPSLTSAGLSAPSYADILDFLKTQYRSIYGADVYLESDSMDGQFLAIVASSINDANACALAVYNAFSPATAQGNSLSSNVKLNGMTRHVATNSTAIITVVGVAGTAVIGGVVQDAARNKWSLPATVNIGSSGQVDVTATCQVAGAITAQAGSINAIITPQLGWQSATNHAAAVPGAPVETDAALRKRQAASVAPAAQSTLTSLVAAVAAVPGVSRYVAYENAGGVVDINGLPAHSVAVVTEGGDAALIAQAIANTKTIGTTTAGSITQTVTDHFGIPRAISYFPVANQRIIVNLSLRPINGYTATIGAKIQAAVAAYINSLPIGQNVFLLRLVGPASLAGDADGMSYELLSVLAAVSPATPVATDVPIAFNQAAHCDPADVVINLV